MQEKLAHVVFATSDCAFSSWLGGGKAHLAKLLLQGIVNMSAIMMVESLLTDDVPAHACAQIGYGFFLTQGNFQKEEARQFLDQALPQQGKEVELSVGDWFRVWGGMRQCLAQADLKHASCVPKRRIGSCSE